MFRKIEWSLVLFFSCLGQFMQKCVEVFLKQLLFSLIVKMQKRKSKKSILFFMSCIYQILSQIKNIIQFKINLLDLYVLS